MTAMLDLEVGDEKVSMHAAKVREPPDGVLRDSPAPTKSGRLALGALWLGQKEEALNPRWDPLRCGVLGYPFTGYLLSRPFVVLQTRHLDIHVESNDATSPVAVRFAMGDSSSLSRCSPASRSEVKD